MNPLAQTPPYRVGGWGKRERSGPAEAPNTGTPATPRPASGIVLLRRGGKHSERALEVLLLKRSGEAKFMPNVWVFPGGAVDAEDGEGEQGHRACAMRELAEEASIELPADEELVLFSRWVTPEIVSTRFDAWFYLALAPAHTPPAARRGRDRRGPLVQAGRGDRRAGVGRDRALLPDHQPAALAAPVPHLRRRPSPPSAAATSTR